MILDLMNLNKLVEYQHFKMFNLNTAVDLLTRGCFMASVDLTDAYYVVHIAGKNTFLKVEGTFEYQVLPNGSSPSPRLFTKLLKSIYAKMGELGHICFPYIDDSFVMGTSKAECLETVSLLITMLKDLGFSINMDKSQLCPNTLLTFLGFELNSVDMLVSLTQEKKDKLRSLATLILKAEYIQIREVPGLIGFVVSCTPGVEHSGAHFKALERDKIKALKRVKGNFDGIMWLSPEGKEDIKWWLRIIITLD